MGNLLSRLRNGSRQPERANETYPISVVDWARMFQQTGSVNYGGRTYPSFSGAPITTIDSTVYTCEAKRVKIFSEARLAWQRLRDGRAQPGDLFGTPELSILEVPWSGASTRDLLAITEIDAAVYGNSYWIRAGSELVRLDPNTVRIVTAAVVDPVSGFRVGEQLIGYSVHVDNKITIYDPTEIAHYKGIPDKSRFKGMSWIATCLPDIEADTLMTEHKRSQIRNGATLTHLVNLDPNLEEAEFDRFVEMFNEKHSGPQQAGKTLFLQGGSDVKTVGQTFEQMSLTAMQGAGETRICAASGLHPALLGFSEGLKGSALNAGNYDSAKRNFVDSEMAPAWGGFCAAFASLVRAPGGTRLWYDARDIPFLREDITALAAVMEQNAKVISLLITAGYDSDAVVRAVIAGDVAALLGNHTGYYSVQLQQLGSASTPPARSSIAAA